MGPPSIQSISPSSGPSAGGTSVVLTGMSLQGTSAVNFGSTPASSFTVNSNTQITAITPAGSPGAVPISFVMGSVTHQASQAANFTYV